MSADTGLCEGCTWRIIQGQEPVCDGSGVLVYTDWPKSRVVLCPGWQCDQDEPTAYWQAVETMGYDAIPPRVQQRVGTNVLAQITPQATTADDVFEQDDSLRCLLAIAALLVVIWWVVAK